jgi:hypothetical protein
LWPSERIDQRLSIAEEMVDLSERIEEIEPRHQSLFFRGVVRLENGDRTGFEADLAGVTQLAIDSRGYWVPMAVTNLWRTLLFLLDGRIEEAEACVGAGYGAVPHSDLIFRTSFTAQLFAIRREQGRLRELIPGFETVPRKLPLPAVLAGLALAYAEVGDFESARDCLGDLVAEDFSALRRDSTWTIQLADLADVVDLSGATQHADAVYRLLAPRRGQLVVASLGCFCAGAVDRYLGMMADLAGSHDLSARHFEEALRLETRIGSEALVARTKTSYARMLYHRGEDRSREAARELLDESLTVCRRLGLIALERRAIALQAEIAS